MDQNFSSETSQDFVGQKTIPNLTIAMVAFLTIFSLILVASLANLISVADFGAVFGFSESKISALNLLISRLKELNSGAIAVFLRFLESIFS